jgi:hypothetical protein
MCHTVAGTDAGARLGPDLTHLASRRTLAAGTLPNTAAIPGRLDPRPATLKPGVNMPPRPCRRRPESPDGLPGDPEMTNDRACQGNLPEPAREPSAHAVLDRTWSDPPGLVGWFAAINHKTISMRFMVTTFGFFSAGGVLALLIRLQLARPDNKLIGPTSTTSSSPCTAPR